MFSTKKMIFNRLSHYVDNCCPQGWMKNAKKMFFERVKLLQIFWFLSVAAAAAAAAAAMVQGAGAKDWAIIFDCDFRWNDNFQAKLRNSPEAIFKLLPSLILFCSFVGRCPMRDPKLFFFSSKCHLMDFIKTIWRPKVNTKLNLQWYKDAERKNKPGLRPKESGQVNSPRLDAQWA